MWQPVWYGMNEASKRFGGEPLLPPTTAGTGSVVAEGDSTTERSRRKRRRRRRLSSLGPVNVSMMSTSASNNKGTVKEERHHVLQGRR